MVENSTAGLAMVAGEVAVTVTGEERHQNALARYAPAPGGERRVAVELVWCVISAGKYKGQRAIEVRLDGRRVGELTYLMSQRYAPLVTTVTAHGGRAGCEAVIERDTRGLQLTLRMPRDANATPTAVAPTMALPAEDAPTVVFPAIVPTLAQAPAAAQVPAAANAPVNTFTRHRKAWIVAGAVVAVLFFAAIANNDDDPTRPVAADETTTTTTVADLPTTTSAAATTTTTTTTPPPPTTTVEQPPPPQPEPTTEQPAPPPPAAEPAPQQGCDPNYSGCVPIASDVDCAGGSGNGPAYVSGPVNVIGTDIYDLDRDGNGVACE